MVSAGTTFCCLLLFLITECYHQRPKLHPKVGGKIQGLNEKSKTKGFPGQCQGNCLNGSHCKQFCENPFHGEIGFTCNNKRWQKSIETCTSLTIQTLFQETNAISVYEPSLSGNTRFSSDVLLSPSNEEFIESAVEGIQKKCPDDYACIINSVRSAEVTSGNIAFIVELLKNISIQLSSNINPRKMQSLSMMANHVLNRAAISNWAFIPERTTSSVLLQSVNSFAENLNLNDEPENIVNEPFIQTKGFRINQNTQGKSFNFSMRVPDDEEDVEGTVFISQEELQKLPPASQAISIAFPTLGRILEEAHLYNESLPRQVNGLVLSVILPKKLQVFLTFEKINKSHSAKAQCVGWHSRKRRWVEEACETTMDVTDKASCRCNYTNLLMSFSILMSPKTFTNKTLDYITCIGLSISILSLILCLIIEITVWSQVTVTEISYMRHVCIVNIATSLLIANVWFIVASFFDGAVRSYNWCVTVTFFSHYFYLSLFFWMLIKALLILYGILIVFRRMMKSTMMAIAFLVGYGCPLVIAAITVSVTEPRKGYVRAQACWLNWDDSRALLAFVIPALTIVAVNLIVVFVVAVNTRRPSIGSSKSQDMVTIMRISKNVAILTPLLGLTWGFGIATLIDSSSLVFHIIFALLNAFQGFFILLFGTILDQKTREALKVRMSSLKGTSRIEENSTYNPNHGSKLVVRSP